MDVHMEVCMERFAMKQLIAWKDNPRRKPLVVRGARQVGKTYLLKQFGERNFNQCIYLNFDKDANPQQGGRLHNLFEGSLEPSRIISAIEILLETTIDPESTLLIFDEVQESPRALNSLKYFNEQAPEYMLIAAGSHLGIALHEDKSLPVGKVAFLYLYPMSFAEYLHALGRSGIASALEKTDWETISLVHDELVDLLKQYYCVGGMPEAVDEFLRSGSYFAVRDIQKDLLELYRADFSKHAPANQLARIWQVWDSIPIHLSRENKKFIWGVLKSGARSKDYEIALRWLSEYGVTYQVPLISKPAMPLSSYAHESAFKLFLLDVGLLGAMAGLEIQSVLDGDTLFTEFKGALTEQYVCQELIAQSEGGRYSNKPYYWAANTAEVDFVVQSAGVIVPLEVKAAENLKSQSLKSYIQRYSPSVALRASLSRYREQELLTNIPLYSIGQLESIVRGLK